MPEPDRRLPRAAWLCLLARYPVEVAAGPPDRIASGVSTTAQEGVDDQKCQEIQRGLRPDSLDVIVSRDVGEQHCRLERHLSACRVAGASDSQSPCPRPLD